MNHSDRTPVPYTGRSRWHRRSSPGVSANSHVISHRYADEGEKGQLIRRLVRRREKRMWRREAVSDSGRCAQ